MGQHHHFARLKTYARKSYGMHQSVLISKVADSGLQKPDICQTVRKGICGTLVTYWVKDMLKIRQNSLFVPPPKEGEGIGPDTFKAGFNFKDDAAYYITLVCVRARHAIGISGSHGRGFTFFDPNAGEYEVPGRLFERFLSDYRAILEKSLNFGKIESIVISKATLTRT